MPSTPKIVASIMSNPKSVQTSLQIDPGTAQAIEELKTVFGVSSNAAVIRKAIALSRVAARNASDADNTVTLIDKAGDRLKVALDG